jgi:hypothetical protein
METGIIIGVLVVVGLVFLGFKKSAKNTTTPTKPVAGSTREQTTDDYIK